MKKKWLILLLIVALLPVHAHALSFSITDHVMDIRIAEDGTGYVEETLTYAFDDTYNGILLTLGHADLPGFGGLSIRVDDGVILTEVPTLSGSAYTYTLQNDEGKTEVRAFTPGEEGTRTYQISYYLQGLATRYQDAARLNHVAIRSETALAHSTLRITLPGQDDAQIDAFVHGAMDSGQMTLQDGVITLGPGNIAENMPVEVDILFPATWLTDAPAASTTIYEEAIAQEAAIALAAEQAAARKAEQARILAIVIIAALFVYAISAVILFFALKKRYGLKHRILPVYDPDLLDSMTAAQAQALKDGAANSAALSATFLELADKGILQMETAGEDTLFTRVQPVDAALPPHQAFFLTWLFSAEGETLSIAALDSEDQEKAQHFINNYNQFLLMVTQDNVQNGWLHAKRGLRTAAGLGVLVIGLMIAFFLMRNGLWPLGIPALLLAVVLCVLFSRLRALTDEGERRISAIDGFLASYEDMLIEDPRSVLGRAPLAMVLGYMEPLTHWIDTHQGTADDAYAPYPVWVMMGWHHSIMHMQTVLQETQSHSAGVVSGGMDSSGSGGGFSGGTGGGNSYGAW